MAYDYATDIKNLTGITDISDSLIDWAVEQAKTIYIADDPANYDDDESLVDNRLVSMLAAGFITLNINGISVGVNFKLDEFSVEETQKTEDIYRFFNDFFRWLYLYQARGVTLNWKDTAGIILVTDYDPTLYEITRTLPQGLEA